jgi:hypothetical protein
MYIEVIDQLLVRIFSFVRYIFKKVRYRQKQVAALSPLLLNFDLENAGPRNVQ